MFAKARFLLMLAILLCGAAFVTAPLEGAAELKLREAIRSELATTDLDRINAPLGQVALAACKLDMDSCYEVLRSQIETRYEHRSLYSVFTVEGFGKTVTCYGLFTRYFCPGGLVDLQG